LLLALASPGSFQSLPNHSVILFSTSFCLSSGLPSGNKFSVLFPLGDCFNLAGEVLGIADKFVEGIRFCFSSSMDCNNAT